ncbi:MAG: putative RNA uridine N3 methyltransferase [Candidatus Thorarchaeota archaeon]
MSSNIANPESFSISIAIPSSFIDVYSSTAEKTQQVGRIARAVAIFQAEKILVYLDRKNRTQMKNQRLITYILEYMETPQYLRKYLFGKLPELRYAGLLPPLRTPHHPLAKKAKSLKPGEVREGVAFEDNDTMVVDVGVETPLPLLNFQATRRPKRLTVKILREKPNQLFASPCPPPSPQTYWGYKVMRIDTTLGDYLTTTDKHDFVIATSRRGTPLNEQIDIIRNQWQKNKEMLLLFGSHKEGLSEILRREGHKISGVSNHMINLLKYQGTASIRTEEAVFIGLAAFRLLEQIER